MNKVKQIIKKVKNFFGKVFHKEKPCFFSKFKVNKANKTGVALVVLAIILGTLYYFRGLFISAVVNGQPISRFSVINKLEKQSGKSIVDGMITEKLIYQEAKKLNAIPSDDEIKKEVEKVRTQIKNSGQDLNTLLAFQKMTIKDLEAQVRLQKTVEKILADKVAVTEEEITKWITDNKNTIPANMKQEEVRTAAEQQIKSQKLGTEFQKWLEKVKATSDIKYLVTYE
jgi:uncharacterized coiled-coil protein SlyX